MSPSEYAPADFERLRDGIVDAYTSAELNELLVFDFAESLDDLVGAGGWKQRAFELIQLASRQGWLPDLIARAQARRPKRPRLFEAARDVLATVSARDPESRTFGALQALLPGRFFQPGPEFMRRLEACFHQVCRVESLEVSPNGVGTGFLVGPDLVLTNYHVVQLEILKARQASSLRCRFDLYSDQEPGLSVPLAGEWSVCNRGPHASDTDAAAPGPVGPEDLDFALLRLAQALGDGNTAAGAKRGWIGLRHPAEPSANDPMVMLQHPLRLPLQISVGRVLEKTDQGRRVRYDAATLKGSSGSPCFNANLDLIALHHGSDPGSEPRFNRGIPANLIRSYLNSQAVELTDVA